jgi:solute:Na+ symporter, SSS family
MRIHLTPTDLAVLLAFFALLGGAWIGARKKIEGAFEFLSAGRSLTLGAFVATLVSTWYGGILGVAESVSYYGVGTWLLMGLPYYIFAAIYSFFIAGRVRSEDQITIPERFRVRFGEKSSIAASILVLLLAIPAAHVLMLGVMIQSLTGLSLPISMILVAIVVSIALSRSGLLADVRIGIVGFALMFLGFTVAFLSLNQQLDLKGAIAKLPENGRSFTGEADWVNILSFFVLGAWTIVDPGFHQRVSSAKDERTGKLGVLISIGCWALFDFLSISCAIYAIGNGAMEKNSARPLFAYPFLAEHSLPKGVSGLFVIGILGTILSACCGYALVAGGTIGRELKRSEDLKWTKAGIVLSLVFAIPVAAAAGNSVVGLWYGWAGAVVGSLLIPFVLSYRSKLLLSDRWMMFNLLAPATIAIGWMIYANRTGNALMMVKALGSEFSLGTLIPSFIVSLLIFGLSRLSCKEHV